MIRDEMSLDTIVSLHPVLLEQEALDCQQAPGKTCPRRLVDISRRSTRLFGAMSDSAMALVRAERVNLISNSEQIRRMRKSSHGSKRLTGPETVTLTVLIEELLPHHATNFQIETLAELSRT
ncbi:hypothetical protein AC579_5087 [Pseudocercospora musae]|uniref:Uncharacterized protein n=1 Tax=Pseudocercospora musae TaxID=113226 RepID=A0A139IN30_9PEZI|nr:hypothetical protein AC579_5087 [Pseudocercospora musae]